MDKEMHRALTQIAAIALFGIGLVLIPVRISWAQFFGTPTVYRITIREICFNTTGNGTFPANLCFVPSPQEFDLAAVAAGGTAGTLLFSGIPANTYIQVRATVSCTFGLKGTVTDLGTGTVFHTTKTGGSSTVAGDLAEGQYKLAAENCADPAADGGQGRAVVTSPAPPNNISLNLGGNVDLVTNVTNGLSLFGGVLRPASISISIVTPP